jgi:hypothetical protein
MEEFVSSGEWWLPNSPEIVIRGQVSFSPSSGTNLKLIGSFYDSLSPQEIGEVKDLHIPSDSVFFKLTNTEVTQETRFSKLNFEYEQTIILGRLENNEKVTLYLCYGSTRRFELVGGKSNLSFQATYIFRKIHFKTEEEIRFNSISVQYSYLEEWIGKSDFQSICSRKENKVRLSYQPLPYIPIAEFENLDMPINKCVEIICDFRDFMTFAMSTPSSMSAITGKVSVNCKKQFPNDDGLSSSIEEATIEDEVNILFGIENFENSSEREIFPDQMLFLFGEIESSLGEIFEKWLYIKTFYEPVFELFMATMYAPNLYLHHGFLNMIQALEFYYGKKYKESKYQPTEIYKKGISKNLLGVIKRFSSNKKKKNGISDDFREVLEARVRSDLNRLSLRNSLENLLLEHLIPLLPDNFIGAAIDKKSFIKKAADTRNALTHHSQKEKAATGEELHQVFHTLKVIVQSCLLQELGFKDESIKKLIERNRDYKKEWRPSNKVV